MRFLACAVLLLSAAALANAAVGRNEEPEVGAHQRYRVFKKNEQELKPEGRTLTNLLALKGCSQAPTGTTTTTITGTPTTTDGSSTTTTTPLDSSTPPSTAARDLNHDIDDDESADDDEDNDEDGLYNDNEDALIAFDGASFSASHRGYSRPNSNRNSNNNGQVASVSTRQVDYELLRRQEEENKLLRQRIQYLRNQNQQTRRRALRARRQERRRYQMKRRQLIRQNRNSRNRLNRRNRQNRRRRNNRRRN